MGVQNQDIQDWELLRLYAERNSQEAFAQIVRRYVNLVWSTCFRDLRDRHAAEDATQAVFLVLARKASSLGRGTVLAGWLYRTARLVSRNALKQEARRKERERRAAEMAQITTDNQATWSELEPLVNGAIDKLGTRDRDAVLLHFIQGKTMAEVGAAMGTSEDAARMRITRAIDRLRRGVTARGLATTVGALTAMLAANAVQAAPAACSMACVAACAGAAAVAAAGSAGITAAGSGQAALLAKGALKTMLFIKIKIAAAVTVVVLLAPVLGVSAYRVLAAPAATTQPATQEAKLAITDVLRLTVEEGQLVGRAQGPLFDKLTIVSLRNLAGSGSIKNRVSPDGSRDFSLFNVQEGPAGEIVKTQIRIGSWNQLTNPLYIQRSIEPKNGKQYRFILMQAYTQPTGIGTNSVKIAVNPGEAVLCVIRDDAKDAADSDTFRGQDFSKLAVAAPLEYNRYLRPLFRDLGATQLLSPLPSPFLRHILGDPQSPEQLKPRVEALVAQLASAEASQQEAAELQLQALMPDAIDILKLMDRARWQPQQTSVVDAVIKSPILSPQMVKDLGQSVEFAVDCLECSEQDIRAAALARLRKLTGKPVDFDPSAPEDKRQAALRQLREQLAPATTKPAAN